MALDTSYPDEEVDSKKLETPAETIAQSEQLLSKAALEGKDDYSLSILDAVYEGYRRNLEALGSVSHQDRQIWETESLNATYPRAYLIWDEVQGSALDPKEREIAQIIAKRAIEVESETAERMRAGQPGMDYQTAYNQKNDWEKRIQSLLFVDTKDLEENLITKAKELVAEKGSDIGIFSDIGQIISTKQESLDTDTKSHKENVKADLKRFYFDMRNRIVGKSEFVKQRYPDEKAYEDCDNTSRYSAVGMGNAHIPTPQIDMIHIFIEVMRRNPSLVQQLKDRIGHEVLMGDEVPRYAQMLGRRAVKPMFTAYKALQSEEQA